MHRCIFSHTSDRAGPPPPCFRQPSLGRFTRPTGSRHATSLSLTPLLQQTQGRIQQQHQKPDGKKEKHHREQGEVDKESEHPFTHEPPRTADPALTSRGSSTLEEVVGVARDGDRKST